MAQLIPLPFTCLYYFSKIQISFTFLLPAHPGSHGKRAVKYVFVCGFPIGLEFFLLKFYRLLYAHIYTILQNCIQLSAMLSAIIWYFFAFHDKKIQKSQYFLNSMTDLHKIWHDDGEHVSEVHGC